MVSKNSEISLDRLMRGPVSEALNIPKHVIWGLQSGDTFTTLSGDFMKPAVSMGKIKHLFIRFRVL